MVRIWTACIKPSRNTTHFLLHPKSKRRLGLVAGSEAEGQVAQLIRSFPGLEQALYLPASASVTHLNYHRRHRDGGQDDNGGNRWVTTNLPRALSKVSWKISHLIKWSYKLIWTKGSWKGFWLRDAIYWGSYVRATWTHSSRWLRQLPALSK